MNGVLGHDSALLGYTGPGTTWVNEMNSAMNHAPGALLGGKFGFTLKKRAPKL